MSLTRFIPGCSYIPTSSSFSARSRQQIVKQNRSETDATNNGRVVARGTKNEKINQQNKEYNRMLGGICAVLCM